MSFSPLANNATTNLGADYLSGSGSFTLASGYGAILAAKIAALGQSAISSTNPLRFTVVSIGGVNQYGQIVNLSKVAIYKASSLTGDILGGVTIQEGTTDQPFASGDFLCVEPTGGTFKDIHDAIAALGGGGNIPESQVTNLVADLAAKAPLASPGLTGTPTAPTAAPGTNTTQIATAAFVATAVANLINGAPGALDTLKELADAINDDASFAATLTTALALKAPLASPSLTGAPTAPTATVGTNTTQLATTAFVLANAGSGSVGGSGTTGKIAKWTGSAALGNATAGTDHVAPGGVAGGQTVNGGTAASDGLTLVSTAHATKGNITLGTSLVLQPDGTLYTPTPGTNGTFNNNSGTNYWFDGVRATSWVVGTTAGHDSASDVNHHCGIVVSQDAGGAVSTITLGPENDVGGASADTVVVLNNTATTGATLFVVKAGAGQGSNNLFEARDHLGAVLSHISATGGFAGDGSGLTGITESQVTNLTTDLAAKAPLASPALTGTPTAPTAAGGTNTTQLATTAFVATAVANLINGAPGALDTLKELADAINDDASYAATITTALALKAPLASPTLTGVPLAPTAAGGTNTTQIATTAFVAAAVSTLATDSAVVHNTGNETIAGIKTFSLTIVGSINGNAATATNGVVTTGSYADPAWITSLAGSKITGNISGNAGSITGSITESQVTSLTADLAAKAPLVSPALTGTPTAPTATVGTNTTQLATTAFVLANAGGGGGGGDLLAALVNSPVSVTGTTSLSGTAFGKLHVCSGTSANYTVTLPDPSGNAGKLIGFRMAPLASLSKLVTIAQHASEVIDGAASRVMWAGETAFLLCDGTDWFKVSGKSIPMCCGIAIVLGSTTTAQTLATGTNTLVLLDTSLFDNTGLMADVSNHQILIKRPALYAFKAQAWWNTLSAAITNWYTTIDKNGSTLISAGTSGLSGAGPSSQSGGTGSLAVADALTLVVYQDSGADQHLLGDPAGTACFLHVLEIPQW